ncbi:MAG: rRNA maturation RNase YbeY, partial [Clostridiaceae bacterium]
MILISNIQESIKVDDDFINFIEKIIDFALKEEEVLVDYEVSILLCDNSEIRSVNKEHRNIDKETDVLSFPMLNYENGKYYKEQYMDGIFNQEDL